MNDENARCAYDGEEYAQLSLVQLPVEMFLHICSFLDASTLVHSLSLVCKQFYQILKDDDLLWKARIDHILPNASHSLLCPERPDNFWKLSCVAIEKQTALWKQQNSMENLRFPGLCRNENSVLLMPVDGITYLVGIKDCNLFCKKLSYREEPFYEVKALWRSAFGVESLTAINHTVYHSCPDHTVKSWVLTNTGLVHDRTYDPDPKCDLMIASMIGTSDSTRCMSSCPEQARFAIGVYDGTIYVYDSRSSSNKPISQYQPERSSVTNLAMNAEYILSASCGGRVSIWDQRAGRIMKSITIPGSIGFPIPVKAYPTYIDMRRDLVCVGDNEGKLHMLEPKNDFELVKSYSTEHTDEITGVRLTHGCLITSSLDGTVRISSPTDPPKLIATLEDEYSGKYIYSMDYLNDTLAIAGKSIVVWRPRNRRV
ncbi:F-box/WD repeat-containing protein 9-like isoform X1 [Temnothorax curvispinosus]|uniref:F-box/WD repeat-containing protein 9-like isoform X1 n=2 Tax=Temnothorax curvispinosus TaxID=300111 RepID=A0A6J1QIP4_9HYME|nr:F-box/WD repeat-containing protein 9-like isoform X1 [Temnothorax curvispinosus]